MPASKDKKTGGWYYYGRTKTSQGKPYRYKKRGFATQLDALLAEKEFLDSFIEKDTREQWDLYTERYLAFYLTQVKESTFLKTRSIFDRLVPSEIKKDFTNHQKIQDFINECDNKYSKDYVEKIFFSMSKFYRWCIREDLINRNPMEHVHRNQRKQTLPDRIKFWEPDQFHRFLQHIKEPEYHAAYNTLFYTGMRKGELQALQWKDVNLQKGTISITKTLSHNFIKGSDPITAPKTKQSIRTITVPTFLVLELKELKRINSSFSSFSDDFYVFGGVSPLPAENLRRHFKKGIEEENMAIQNQNQTDPLPMIPIHGLRHSHASYLIHYQKYGKGEQQYTEFDIANRLGDRVETLHTIYFHWFQSADTKIAEVIQNLEDKKKPSKIQLDKQSLSEEELKEWMNYFLFFSQEFQTNIEKETICQIPIEYYLMNGKQPGQELVDNIKEKLPKEKRSKRNLLRYLLSEWDENMLLF